MAPVVPDDIVRNRFSLAPQTGDPEWGAAIADVAPLQDDLLRGADELATIIYTSGTTGMPKGVMHSFANIAATAKTMGEVFKFGPDERVPSYSPLDPVAERIGAAGNSPYHGFRLPFAESLVTCSLDLPSFRPTV